MESLEAKFKSLKKVNWGKAAVTFYIVKRQLIQRVAKYSVLRVNVDKALRFKIRNIIKNKIERSNKALEYDFHTADLDDDLLSLNTTETDFQNILDQISSEELFTVDNYEELFGSWLYIARLDKKDNPPLFSVRKISDSWTAKKITQLVSMIFKNNMLIDLDEKEIFRIDGNLDFLSFDGMIFIADKKNFETALNFREGMEKNRDEIVEEFESLSLFKNAKNITKFVGNNMRRLRKLSQVKKAGYYKDKSFLKKLKKVNEKDSWGIKFSEDGKIIVNEEDIDIILTVLNNDRLHSKINDENFDVEVKHKIG